MTDTTIITREEFCKLTSDSFDAGHRSAVIMATKMIEKIAKEKSPLARYKLLEEWKLMKDNWVSKKKEKKCF